MDYPLCARPEDAARFIRRISRRGRAWCPRRRKSAEDDIFARRFQPGAHISVKGHAAAVCSAEIPAPMHDKIIPIAQIQARIHHIRGKRVMLDADLARFYRVATRDLNKAVSRNLDRFPEDFAFVLTRDEARNLMFQSGTSSSQLTEDESLVKASRGYGGTRKPARVFTEQGVAMLASVLRSQRAVAVSVALVRAFVQLRELLATHRELSAKLTELERKVAGHDHAIRNLFETIRQLLEPAEEPNKKLGFHTGMKKPEQA